MIARLLCLLPITLALGCCSQEGVAPERNEGAASSQPESPEKGQIDRSHAGTMAPEAEFQDPEGGAISLVDFRGKPVLVNLWATWCAPCIAEMPTLDALAEREEGKLHVLALSQDTDGAAKVNAFFAKRDYRMLEPFIDPEMKFLTEVGVERLPTTILYDAKGRELWRMSGGEDWQSDRADAFVAEAIGAKEKARVRTHY